jgi:antitoxin component YwqK of YwqJK toxin-antitoxin module
LFANSSFKLYRTVKDSKFCFVLFLMLAFHSMIAQTDYNKVDEKEKKNGVWKGFYPESKRPRYEGTFEHGKEIGVFSFYDDTKAKSLIATREFNTTDNSAYTIFYDQAKNRVSEGKVIDKLFTGEWKYYHQASKIVMILENYKNGKLEGLRSVYYPSGNIAEEISYQNNIKNGLYKSFSENGIILEQSIYKNNEYNGLATFKDAQGNVVSKGLFLNGKKSGIWQFFTNGKLVNEINMITPGTVAKSGGN